MNSLLKGTLIGSLIGFIGGIWSNTCSEFNCIPSLPFSIGNIISNELTRVGGIFWTPYEPTAHLIGLIINIIFYLFIGLIIGSIFQKKFN